LFRSHFQHLPCRFVQVHVVKLQRCIIVNRDGECVLDVVEGGSALNNVGRVIRGPHAAYLLGIAVFRMVAPVSLIYPVQGVVHGLVFVLHLFSLMPTPGTNLKVTRRGSPNRFDAVVRFPLLFQDPDNPDLHTLRHRQFSSSWNAVVMVI